MWARVLALQAQDILTMDDSWHEAESQILAIRKHLRYVFTLGTFKKITSQSASLFCVILRRYVHLSSEVRGQKPDVSDRDILSLTYGF